MHWKNVFSIHGSPSNFLYVRKDTLSRDENAGKFHYSIIHSPNRLEVLIPRASDVAGDDNIPDMGDAVTPENRRASS